MNPLSASEAAGLPPLTFRISFVDQTSRHASGAQESLALLLSKLPAWIEPTVILFGNGPFAQRLREHGYHVVVHALDDGFANASRYDRNRFSALSAGQEILRLAALFRRMKPDAVHTNTVKAHFIGIPAARLSGIPSAMHLRDSLDGSSRTLLATIGRFLPSHVVAVSRHVSAWYGIPNTRVIYNPFDTSADRAVIARAEACATLGLPEQTVNVGILGPIHENKRHDRFLRALAALKDTNVFGAIVGDPRFGSSDALRVLQTQAHELGVLERVKFIPWLDDVRSAYAALDIICNCSTREPFGRTIVEGAASGIPSVCFNDSGASEVFLDGESAAIASAGDEAAFADRLRQLVMQPALRERLGNNARKIAAGLTVEAHTEHMTAVFQSLTIRSQARARPQR